MVTNKEEYLFYYQFGIILLGFLLYLISYILQFLKQARKLNKKNIFLIIVTSTLFSFLIFKVDWYFHGENKENIIRRNGFLSLLVFTNIINVILYLLFWGLEKLKVYLKRN